MDLWNIVSVIAALLVIAIFLVPLIKRLEEFLDGVVRFLAFLTFIAVVVASMSGRQWQRVKEAAHEMRSERTKAVVGAMQNVPRDR